MRVTYWNVSYTKIFDSCTKCTSAPDSSHDRTPKCHSDGWTQISCDVRSKNSLSTQLSRSWMSVAYCVDRVAGLAVATREPVAFRHLVDEYVNYMPLLQASGARTMFKYDIAKCPLSGYDKMF